MKRLDYHLFGLTLGLATLWLPRPALLGVGVGYLAGVFLAGWLDRAGVRFSRWGVAIPCLLLGTVAPIRLPDLAAEEGWGRHLNRTIARARAERLPALHPRLLPRDQPQRFYLELRNGNGLEIRLRAGEKEWVLEPKFLSDRVACFDWNPHGIAWEEGIEQAELEVRSADGVRRFDLPVPAPNPALRRLKAHPHGSFAAAVSPTTDTLTLVSAGGALLELETGDGPSDVAVGADGRIFVTHRFEPRIAVFDGNEGEPLAVYAMPRGQVAVAMGPGGRHLAVALDGPSPELLLLGPADGTLLRRVAVPDPIDALVFGRDNDEVIAGSTRGKSLFRIRWDAGSEPEVVRVPLQRPVRGMARAADGAVIYLTSGGHAADARDLLGNHQVEHHLLKFVPDEARVTEVTDLVGGDPQSGRSLGLDPMGVAADRDRVLVACQGAGELVAVATDGSGRLVRYPVREAGLSAPRDVAFLRDGTLLASDPVNDRLMLLDSDGRSAVVEPESADPARAGELAFHRATRAGIACASCHHDGGTDQVFYNIGSGIVQTPPLGGIHGTAPYLRQGPHNDIAHLHEDLAMGVLGGYADAGPPDVAALETFVRQLPRTPNPNWMTTSAAQLREGFRVFGKAGCVSCHSPPAFTNLSQHPEAWLFPDLDAANPHRALDVPSLLVAWEKANLLLDGRAESFGELLTRWNAADRHGQTRGLSDEERAALILFLQSL